MGNKLNTDEMTLNEIIIANLPEEISVENKLKRFKEVDNGFLKKGSTSYLLLKPYGPTMHITLFTNLDKISDVFKYLEKYVGKVRLIDTDFDEAFQGKVDFWVGEDCYSLVSADGFTVDTKRGI